MYHAAWSPDGRWLATGEEDGTIRVHYGRFEDLLAGACRRAVRNMLEVEWQRYMDDQDYREKCPGKPVPWRVP